MRIHLTLSNGFYLMIRQKVFTKQKQKFVVIYIVLVFEIFFLFDIIQAILHIKHPPYIDYPYKGAKVAVNSIRNIYNSCSD